jgi:serine phosphatase RsbU (regulator of sigma subunit)
LKIQRKYSLFLLFLSLNFLSFSDPGIDSLKKIITSSAPDTIKIKVYIDLTEGNIPVDEAFDYAQKALALAKQSPNPVHEALAYGALGEVYKKKGQLEKAISAILDGIAIYEKYGKKKELIMSYYSLGIVYHTHQDYKKAIEWKKKALDLSIELRDWREQAICATNLANTYLEQKEFVLALSYYNEAYDIFEKLKEEENKLIVLNNIAGIYFYQERFDKAMEVFKKLISSAEASKDTLSMALYYSNLGECYSMKKDYKQALEFFKKSESLVKNVNDVSYLHPIYLNLSSVYKSLDDYKNAFKYREISEMYEDSIFNMENNRQFHEMTVKYEADTKEKENQLLNQEIELKKVESSRQQLAIILIGVILFIVGIVAFILIRQNRLKNRINKELAEKNHIIQEQHKDITDSIQYSKRIQEAILPPMQLWNETMPESFVLYKPKDILSGDFYWMEKSGDTLFFAAADCTGHGVPGAMVSVICSTALNRAVKEFELKDTGAILDKVRELVLETFEKSESNVQDGMDISICALNTVTRELKWSGANNPLWYLSNNEPREITANKQSIGKTDAPKPFTTHSVQLNRNDIIYVFTDGYADQFGGPKGKKFKYKQLKELLLANASRKMEEQKDILLKAFNNWKGNLEQVDDVCVIGVRV